MEAITFETKMTKNIMFKYLMRHTYTSPMGIVGVGAGLLLWIMYAMDSSSVLYLGGAIIVLAYLPVSLYITAAKQTALNPVFKKPLTYTLTEDTVGVSQDGEGRTIEWEMVIRAVYTKSMIILYTSKVNAWIFPRDDMGDKADAVEALVRRKVSSR